MSEFILSSEQQAAYQLLNCSKQNFFVTGKAGTGKSVLLNYFVKHTAKKAAVCAFTGIAAIHIGGQTINSLFSMDSHEQDTRKSITISDASQKLLSNIDCLIIDEASMIRADHMDMIDAKLKCCRHSHLPFGGCQVILFGDLFQLPPIIGSDAIKTFIHMRFGGVYFFYAPVISQASFTIIELSKIQRQKDEAFIHVLNNIRVANNLHDALKVINTRCISVPASRKVITLTTRRDKAASVNRQKLSCLQGATYVYDATATDDFLHDVQSVLMGTSKDNLPADIKLELKVGAQVMMIKNDLSQPQRWVNGTIGEIADLKDNAVYVRIGHEVYYVEKEQWIKYKYKYNDATGQVEHTEAGTFEQYPIRLAYAMTIHKSQGQTYDGIQIDLSDGKAFEAGQIYVALSRCRTMDGIYLTRPLEASEIKTRPDVIKYLAEHCPT